MKKLEAVLKNIKTGNQFIIRKDKYNEIYGAEMQYDGEIPKDMVLVEIDKFMKEFPHLVKQLTKDNIYRLYYNLHNREYISMIIDKDEKIINYRASNDLYESILELENDYTNVFGKVMRKIKTKIRKVS